MVENLGCIRPVGRIKIEECDAEIVEIVRNSWRDFLGRPRFYGLLLLQNFEDLPAVRQRSGQAFVKQGAS